MKKSNFFLLVKQGLRGVFRFKTQFILMVLLGFFASLILSVTKSINHRINYEYDRTMSGTERFDYYDEQTLEVAGTSQTKTMIPIIDFIADEFLTYNSNAVSYNVNLSKQTVNGTAKETFVTKAFESSEFKTEFNTLIENKNYTDDWFNYEWIYGQETPYYNSVGLDSKMSNVFDTNYWYQFNFINLVTASDENYSPLEYYTDTTKSYLANQFSDFSKNVITILKTQLKNDVIDENGDIRNQNSTFGLLFKNGHLTSDDIIIGSFDYSDLEKFKSNANTYIDLALLSLIVQINKMIQEYVQYHMDLAIANAATYEKTDVMSEFERTSGLLETDTNNTNETRLYSWLFDKNYTPTTTGDSFYISGALGQTNHLDSSGNTADNLDGLKLISDGNFIEKKLQDISGFIKKDNYNWVNADIASTYYVRQSLIAKASELEEYTRYEAIYSDNAEEKHFRLIIADEWVNDKLTVYQGNAPRTVNEILLNPQYAVANNIQIGSNVKIGSADVVVSGFAADPYTNFPVADIDVPFPNNKKGAIAYINKDILDRVITTSEAKVTTSKIYRFFTSNNKLSLDNRMNLFKSLSYNYATTLSQDYGNVISGGQTEIEYNYSMKAFQGSLLALNWTLTPLVMRTFSTVSYLVCAIILAICLVTTLIAIRKTIQFNAGEIGILKALGARSSQIAFSYISYGLILLIIVVPISWLSAGYAQEPFCRLFLSYMGGAYNQVQFNAPAIFILMGLFGGLTIFVSYMTAILLINKPVVEIISKRESIKRIEWIDRLKLKWTKNSKFATKFSLELAISGMKPTLVSAITVLIASLLITTSMSVPGMVSTAVNSYYENVKYSNKIENLESIGNSPLSKTSLSAWNGVDYYDQYLNEVSGNFGNVDYLSDSVTNVSGINEHSILPKFLFIQDGDGNLTPEWGLASYTNEELLKIIGYVFGNNITQTIGRSVNIAEIQRIIEFVVHDSSNPDLNAEERAKIINDLTAVLSEGLPPLLKAVFPSQINDEGEEGWKDLIMAAILSQAPSYVKSYLNRGENRFNQYSFGWTFTNYIPGDDDFYTKSSFLSTDSKNDYLTGIQSNQKAYKLDYSSQQMFIDEESLNQLESVLNGWDTTTTSITTANGFNLLSNSTLNIPVTMNDQAKFDHGKTGNQKIEVDGFFAKRLVMSKDNTDIPNSAWIYDDNDWAQNRTGTFVEGWSVNNFLDPSALDTSKFTMSHPFTYSSDSSDYTKTKGSSQLTNLAMGFADFYNNGTTTTTEIRPYYSYDNLYLMVPREYKDSLTALQKGSTKNTWYGTISDTNLVPTRTVDDWNIATGKNYTETDFIWIRPYSLYYDDTYSFSQEPGEELGNLLTYNNSFFRQNFLESNPGIIDDDIELKWEVKLNLVPVSSVGVYGSSIILADQGLANILHGYSTSTYTPYNYVYEKSEAGSYKLNNGYNVKTYEWNTDEDLLSRSLEDQIWGTVDQKAYSPSNWFTGIMSQSTEPYFLTSQASFSKSVRTGEYTLSGNSQYYDTIEMDSVEFLTEQKALINQIAGLVLTIAISFIIIIIITATLSMIIITDLYVNQYKKFMIVMKSLGYSNWKVIKYSFGMVTVLAGLMMILGIGGSCAIVVGVGVYIERNVGSIPLGLSWWALLISALLLVTSFITSISITTWKIRRESPVSLMR